MKTILCLLAALAGADAAIVTCRTWPGTCQPGQVSMGEGRCVNAWADTPPGEEVPLCAGMCCRYPRCAAKVSCPAGYKVNALRPCSTVNAKNRENVGYCSQLTCCDTTCGVAVTCPANTDSAAQKTHVCSVHPDYSPRCNVETCCRSTCASAYTCPADYDSTTAASVECTSASDMKDSDVKGSDVKGSDTAACTTDLCCRTSCKSNAHKCPAGWSYGKLASRACRKSGGAMDESRLPVCSNAVCCEVSTKCPADFVCGANTKQKADVTTVDCAGTCAAADCCVDVPVTCAAAASKCTGRSTLKATPDKIVCGLSAIAPAADACTLDKCCDVKKDVQCADNAACRANGDSGAACQNGACLCTLMYKSTKKSCVLNRLFFAVTFKDGDYSKLTAAHRDAVSVALTKKLTKLLKLSFSQGSIVISGEAETLPGSVSDTEIVDAVKTAIPASVLGTAKVQTTVGGASNVCKSTDAGAVTAVKAPFASGTLCVPTLCNVAKGYVSQPVAHKCVQKKAPASSSDDGLTEGQKIGIALGAIGFVAIVVGVAVLVSMKGRRSAAGPAEFGPPSTTQMKELPSGSL